MNILNDLQLYTSNMEIMWEFHYISVSFFLMLSFKALNIPNDLTQKMSSSGFIFILIENFVKEIFYAFLRFPNHPEK